MKRFLLFAFMLGFVIAGYAQIKPNVVKAKADVSVLRPQMNQDGNFIGLQGANSTVSNYKMMDDPSIGFSKYDKQTNGSNSSRIYRFDDGTVGGVFTYSHLDDFTERGTGYNYYNGTAWGAGPNARIENVRTGWPSYAPFGANGEMVVAHRGATYPLIISTRATKGVGAWTQTELAPPPGASGVEWPRVVTNGPNHTYIHILAVTGPTANGGAVYQGLDGALLYNRSLNGGETWDGWQLLEGMTSTEYLSFTGENYAFAQPKGDTLCFTVGDSWFDQFIMKSTDNGTTWTKRIIWASQTNQWVGGDSVARFYGPDGVSAIALDKNGMAHVVFGYMRSSGDEAGDKYWFSFTDGVIYWNESMDELPQEMDRDTLIAHGNYIGWIQDTMIYYAATTELAWYFTSLSSYPSIVTDDYNNIFVVWASVTNNRDQNSYMLRGIFARASTDNGATWRDTIVQVTSDFSYNFLECVFPSMSPTSDNSLYILAMTDNEAGLYFNGSATPPAQGQTTITNNDFTFMKPTKNSIIVPQVGMEEQQNKSWYYVSQGSPNPFRERATINVSLERPATLSLELYSLSGISVYRENKGSVARGAHQFIIDGSALGSGLYIGKITINGETVTRKMVIK